MRSMRGFAKLYETLVVSFEIRCFNCHIFHHVIIQLIDSLFQRINKYSLPVPDFQSIPIVAKGSILTG